MARKEIGSVTRTIGAAMIGAVLGKYVGDEGLIDFQMLEKLLNGLEYVYAFVGLVIIQGWSLVDKHKAKQTEKQLKEVTHETKTYNS